MPKKKVKWFQAGKPLNWRKDLGMVERRARALKARKGDLLATARALQALSNVTKDKETKQKAREDALYFYRRHKKARGY